MTISNHVLVMTGTEESRRSWESSLFLEKPKNRVNLWPLLTPIISLGMWAGIIYGYLRYRTSFLEILCAAFAIACAVAALRG